MYFLFHTGFEKQVNRRIFLVLDKNCIFCHSRGHSTGKLIQIIYKYNIYKNNNYNIEIHDPPASRDPDHLGTTLSMLTWNISPLCSCRLLMMMASLNSASALGRSAPSPLRTIRALRPCLWWKSRSLKEKSVIEANKSVEKKKFCILLIIRPPAHCELSGHCSRACDGKGDRCQKRALLKQINQ